MSSYSSFVYSHHTFEPHGHHCLGITFSHIFFRKRERLLNSHGFFNLIDTYHEKGVKFKKGCILLNFSKLYPKDDTGIHFSSHFN